MQPYFMPYIGYFQLINAVDKLVVYDEIQYTKKGWINRNRYLCKDKPEYFSLPIKNDSDFLNIKERYLSDDWEKQQVKLLNKLGEAYKKAPYFLEGYKLLKEILKFPDRNLFSFLYNSIKVICEYLGIKTEIIISSSVPFDNSLKAENKVLAICDAINAIDYINPSGGKELYSKFRFMKRGINLFFLESITKEYNQYGDTFVPNLSILDVIMFNDKESINSLFLREFKLI